MAIPTDPPLKSLSGIKTLFIPMAKMMHPIVINPRLDNMGLNARNAFLKLISLLRAMTRIAATQSLLGRLLISFLILQYISFPLKDAAGS